MTKKDSIKELHDHREQEERAFNEAFEEAFSNETPKPAQQNQPAATKQNNEDTGASGSEQTPSATGSKDDDNAEPAASGMEPSPDAAAQQPPAQKGQPLPPDQHPEQSPEEEPSAGEIDWKEKYEAELHRNKSWKGRITAANKRADEATVRLKELEAEVVKLQALVDTLSKQSTKVPFPEEGNSPVAPMGDDPELEQFMADFPDIAPPVQKLIDNKVKQLVAEFKDQQAERMAQEELVRAHFNKIRQAHPDLDELVAGTHVQDWIEAQPVYLQAGLKEVLDRGTADQVIDLLNAFKSDTGVGNRTNSGSPAAPDNNEGAPAQNKGGEKSSSPQVAADLQKMVGVKPSQTGPKTGAVKVKDDFDSAWDEAPEKEFSYV